MRGRGLATWIATVGGLGHVPWAPGTWGSGVGLLLGLVVVRYIPSSAVWCGLVIGIVVSSLLCTQAERAIGRHDAPAIILDEVLAMAGIILLMPQIAGALMALAAAFLLFRVFDIVKPPPLQWLARLPAGWGIVADDLGAAAYTLLLLKLLLK